MFASLLWAQFLWSIIFFKKHFGRHKSFSWGHWCFRLLVMSALSFKARVDPLHAFSPCDPQIQIHFWRDTCWLYGGKHGSSAFLISNANIREKQNTEHRTSSIQNRDTAYFTLFSIHPRSTSNVINLFFQVGGIASQRCGYIIIEKNFYIQCKHFVWV